MKKSNASKYLGFMPKWLEWAEDYWSDAGNDEGYLGNGQKDRGLAHSVSAGYMAACAVLPESDEGLLKACHMSRELMTERALKTFRYIFNSHKSQKDPQWGRHWGSPIVIERVACFVDLLKPHMSVNDLRLWQEVLLDEANYILGTKIETNRFSAQGETHAERNYWRGTILFRTAMELQEHGNAEKWLEKSAEYCINAISLPSDADCDFIIDGKPVSERFLGANAHAGAVFEHHGNISSDYSIIPLSFFTMIMTSAIRNGWQPTESIFHHIGDLWNWVKYLTTEDARIICFGKQRARYTIMYNYLLPALAFWSKFTDDDDAEKRMDAFLELGEKDRTESNDGSFYSARGARLKDLSADSRPFHYFRLESDAVIGRALAYLIAEFPDKKMDFPSTFETEKNIFEKNRLITEDAAFISQKTDSGFFGVYWNRSHHVEADSALAMCIPNKNAHRVDCLSNLSTIFKPFRPERHLEAWGHVEFAGGFATAANYYEGRYLLSDDEAGYAFYQNLAFVLMPDGKSFLRIENTKALKDSTISEIASLNLNLANDIFTGKKFTLTSSAGKIEIAGLNGEDAVKSIDSKWVNIADELGVIGIYGGSKFDLEIFSKRNRAYKTLLVDRLYYPLIRERTSFKSGDTVLNSAVLLLTDSSAEETERTAAGMNAQRHCIDIENVEAMSLTLGNGTQVSVFINFSEQEKRLDINGGINLEPLKPALLVK